jgi:hypothetical protein
VPLNLLSRFSLRGRSAGTFLACTVFPWRILKPWEETVNGLIYLIGLIVVILFILSFFGLR